MSQQQLTPEQNEIQALQVLALATDAYLKSLDELARQCVAPQAQQAVKLLQQALTERWGKKEEAEVSG